MEWSDIRVFLQVARDGAMARATTALQMDHSTISRRISRLEREAGVPLFDRANRRLTLTDGGGKLVIAAEKVESIILQEILSLAEDSVRISGCVKIGVPEELGCHYLGGCLVDIMSEHPDLEIDLIATPHPLSLAAREADISITPDRPETGDLRCRKLTEVEYGLYGSQAYLAATGRPVRMEDLAGHRSCGLLGPGRGVEPDSAGPQAVREMPVQYRTSSVTVQLGAAMGGVALAVIPCFVAHGHSELERLLPVEVCFRQTYWMTVHADLARYRRVRVVMDALHERVTKDRRLFRPGDVEAPTLQFA